MPSYLNGKTIRLRCKKDYLGAHNHVIIGRVVEENASYIAVIGRSFHFTSILDKTSKINTGREAIRVIPWGNVELIHWLGDDPKVDWNAKVKVDEKEVRFILTDDAKTVIAGRNDGITT